MYDLFAVHEGRPRQYLWHRIFKMLSGRLWPCPGATAAHSRAQKKKNRDLGSQNPQNFLACGAASRSLRRWRSEISFSAKCLYAVNPLSLTVTRRAGVFTVVHLVATPSRITTPPTRPTEPFSVSERQTTGTTSDILNRMARPMLSQTRVSLVWDDAHTALR